MKEYDGSPIEDNPQLRGIFANINGRLRLRSQDDDSVCVKFEWDWDGLPMLSGYAVTDVVTCAWLGVDSNTRLPDGSSVIPAVANGYEQDDSPFQRWHPGVQELWPGDPGWGLV